MLASAGVILTLGVMHLWFTFRGNKLAPRDDVLQARMREISPVISRQTTMWKAWVGFNASHSMGAILFGLVYGYLALMQGALLFQSVFLQARRLSHAGRLADRRQALPVQRAVAWDRNFVGVLRCGGGDGADVSAYRRP